MADIKKITIFQSIKMQMGLPILVFSILICLLLIFVITPRQYQQSVGIMEENSKSLVSAVSFGVGVGLETEISETITLNLQTLFMAFANKNLSFRFDSGYSTRMSDETRMLILQGGILYSPF